MRRTFTFDEVALVPQYNNIPSRTEPSLETWMTRSTRAAMPLVPANMDTVIGDDLAAVIIENGGYPIFHRFTDFGAQQAWVDRYPEKTYISAGMHQSNQIRDLLERGARGVCIDVAHGHSEQMLKFLEQLKRDFPEKECIAGNVCTPMAYHDLVNAGADAVKVGIGPGAACTTRMVTGFGVPQFSAVRECAEIADKLRVPLIADGGIRSSRDIVLALAAGASTVMIGKLFALTEESAAVKRGNSDDREAKYRGQASEDFQNDFYGGLKSMTVAEGTDFWAPVSGPAQALIDELLGGLRSGLTYGGARSIAELQRKAEFIEVGPAYIDESRPRTQ